MTDERRRYSRIMAPVYCRPAGWLHTQRSVRNIGLGGARIYSDEKPSVGDRLKLDFYLPEDRSVSCLAEVAWVAELKEDDAPAPFDVGLRFLDVSDDDLELLRTVLRNDDSSDEDDP